MLVFAKSIASKSDQCKIFHYKQYTYEYNLAKKVRLLSTMLSLCYIQSRNVNFQGQLFIDAFRALIFGSATEKSI